MLIKTVSFQRMFTVMLIGGEEIMTYVTKTVIIKTIQWWQSLPPKLICSSGALNSFSLSIMPAMKSPEVSYHHDLPIPLSLTRDLKSQLLTLYVVGVMYMVTGHRPSSIHYASVVVSNKSKVTNVIINSFDPLCQASLI